MSCLKKHKIEKGGKVKILSIPAFPAVRRFAGLRSCFWRMSNWEAAAITSDDGVIISGWESQVSALWWEPLSQSQDWWCCCLLIICNFILVPFGAPINGLEFSFSYNEIRTVFGHSYAERAGHQLLPSQDTICTVQSFKGFGNTTMPKETGKSSHKVWNHCLWCDWKGHEYTFISEIVLSAMSEGTWRHTTVCINSKIWKFLNGRGVNEKEAIMTPYLTQSSLG